MYRTTNDDQVWVEQSVDSVQTIKSVSGVDVG